MTGYTYWLYMYMGQLVDNILAVALEYELYKPQNVEFHFFSRKYNE